MGTFFKFFVLTFVSGAITVQAHDCLPPQSADASVEKAHIRVVNTPLEAQEQFNAVYNDSRRLKNRVFWSTKDQGYVFKSHIEPQKLPFVFIENLQNQLLQALANVYADFVYYGDMGHLHLLIPRDQRTVSFTSRELLSLFHTGELYQFKKNGNLFGPLKEDPHWEWLYWHRNFVAANKLGEPLQSLQAPIEAPYNTVRSIEGFREVGSVYFSANKNGCFELKNESVNLRFDISVAL